MRRLLPFSLAAALAVLIAPTAAEGGKNKGPGTAAPQAASTGETATIVFQQVARTGEYAGDLDVAAQRIRISDGVIAWNEAQSSAVSTSAILERSPTAVSDGRGGIIVVLEGEPRVGEHAGDVDVLAQRLGPDGEMSWNDGEHSQLVAAGSWSERNPRALADGKGGAFVVFEQYSRSGEYAGDIDVAAQRIGRDGKIAWSEPSGGGTTVSSSPQLERNPILISDGKDGIIVIFEAEPRTGDRVGMSAVLAQRLGPDGKMLWNEGNHSSVVSFSAWSESRPVAVSDGKGGAIVFLEQKAVTGDFAGDVDVAAQRIDRNGNAVWNNGDQASDVATSDLSESPRAAVSDGKGGAIVVYEAAARTGDQAGNTQIFAQRIDADGKLLWGEGGGAGLPVAYSAWKEQNPAAISDGKGGVIIAFEQHAPPGEFFGDIDIAAQHVSAAGKVMWHDGERSADVSDGKALERSPSVISDGAGGVIVAFEAEHRTGEHAGDSEVLAQRLSPTGERLWRGGEQPAPVATTPWSEGSPRVVAP